MSQLGKTADGHRLVATGHSRSAAAADSLVGCRTVAELFAVVDDVGFLLLALSDAPVIAQGKLKVFFGGQSLSELPCP
ncbi:hypothetical protein GCM10022256_22530 [Frondihabitans peucedani]|uniref:Uncharacterized protein n=1 Tax=Frondihabitans peucedani TaxID=598626 RepID=A0ABP8E352_9MICO